jgi:hypothetical protein
VLDRSSGVAGDVDCVATALTSPTPDPLDDSTTYEYAVPPVRSEIVAVVAVAPVPSYATIDGVTPSPSSRYTRYPVGAPPAGADHVRTMLSIFISLNVIAPTAAGDVD